MAALEFLAASTGTWIIPSNPTGVSNGFTHSLKPMRPIFARPSGFCPIKARTKKPALVDSLLEQEGMGHGKKVIERSRLTEVDSRFAWHKQAEPPIVLNVTVLALFPAITMTLQVDTWGLIPGWETGRVGDPQFYRFVNVAVFRNDVEKTTNEGTAGAVDTGLEVFQ